MLCVLDWFEKHAGLGGWVGAIVAIFVTWGLARAESLANNPKRFDCHYWGMTIDRGKVRSQSRGDRFAVMGAKSIAALAPADRFSPALAHDRIA
jgi:hypothetical protein